jgi:hypothetical protein
MARSYLDGEEGGEGVEERRVGVRLGQGRRVPVDHVLTLRTHDMARHDTRHETGRRGTHTRTHTHTHTHTHSKGGVEARAMRKEPDGIDGGGVGDRGGEGRGAPGRGAD